jgi:hypothetical protein
LFGTSISPDEINSKPKESLSTVLGDYLSKSSGTYTMGGIGGLPLLGVRGMEDFLSHCPYKGKAFILFGPNVGISDSGIIGKVDRLGQARLSECCEPGLSAYAQIQVEILEVETPAVLQHSAFDNQQEYIPANLRKYVDPPEGSRFSKSDLPAFVTLQMFKLGQDRIMEQLETCLREEATVRGKAFTKLSYSAVSLSAEGRY